ncbi:hypothetical protein [Phenylobacterium sp. J367]|uniref:hypothetical protein n=1 Tax=Phenylobacterium sp. J367 TaxID=2898435 RepID=UPI002151C8C9|nr:hypothetical protein [Phenylobacterium sp. J367]MCR5881196.1 hypothetical protein [Phenylobacterium sp. J367]
MAFRQENTLHERLHVGRGLGATDGYDKACFMPFVKRATAGKAVGATLAKLMMFSDDLQAFDHQSSGDSKRGCSKQEPAAPDDTSRPRQSSTCV